MFKRVKVWAFLLLGFGIFASCAGSQQGNENARILVIGDSVMAWNGLAGQSVPQELARLIGEPVLNLAVSGARVSHPNRIIAAAGFEIPGQFKRGNWQTIIVDGGGNDLFFECGCNECGDVIDQLISVDAMSGEIPQMLGDLRQSGAHVVFTGYHRSRGLGGAYEHCADEMDVIDARMTRFAAQARGVDFINMQDVFPPRSLPHYDTDRVHPSPLGSRVMAERIASFLQSR